MNTANSLVQKVWSFCDTLRDDGLGYNEYLEQLTYLLFLKMADENTSKYNLPSICNWQSLVNNKGGSLQDQYEQVLRTLSEAGGMLKIIFANAQNKIHDSVKLKKLISLIDEENWTSTEVDSKGEIYESLLQKNAENSGAGQYFTPRPVIKAIIKCIRPVPGETISDPSCGTGGFFLGALDYLNAIKSLTEKEKRTIKFDTFEGWEIESATARLCLMNLYLHGIGDLKKTPEIHVVDSLKQSIKNPSSIVLANPPFGKSSSDIPTNDIKLSKKEGYYLRNDFWVTTSNKQLAFLQHIVNMVADNGRAAVVLPDNVLFEGGAGEAVRKELLAKTNLHTILRLPTGIFYAQGVKSNVLFFDKPKSSTKKINTESIWYYDYRTNVHHTPKKNQLRLEDLNDFIKCYNAQNIKARKEVWTTRNSEGRWRKFGIKEILSRDKTNFDIFWIKDESLINLDQLPDHDALMAEIIDNVESALASFKAIKDSVL